MTKAFPNLKTSAKSVQTTRVVCTNYGWSLYRLQLKSPVVLIDTIIYLHIPLIFNNLNKHFTSLILPSNKVFSTSTRTLRDHCIIRHSLRYYRHSGLVIYKSKLPAPSVSMPCDYRILQSPTKGQVKLVLWETVQRSLWGIKISQGFETKRP